MTLSDANSSQVSDCRLADEELDADPDSGVYVVQWDYRCLHTTV